MTSTIGAGRKTGQAGLTLAELLAVLAILVLLSVLAIPAFNLFRSQRVLKDAALSVQFIMREARSMAISQGKDFTVRINPAEESLVILEGTPGLGESGTAVSKKWLAPAAVDIKDVSGSDSTAQISFRSNGSASLNISVHLKRRDTKDSDTNKHYTVTVINTTGAAKVYPYQQ